MTSKMLIALALVGGCAVAEQSDRHAATWSSEVACTEVVSHPCPWQVYTTTVEVDRGLVVWTDAVGGADDNGVPAAERDPLVEVPSANSTALHAVGAIALPQRGDDGGLRHAFQLVPAPGGGWTADVTWTLFNVAGETTFHLVVEP